jgi:protocatechuate 3,4-dioxygenase beta subunit
MLRPGFECRSAIGILPISTLILLLVLSAPSYGQTPAIPDSLSYALEPESKITGRVTFENGEPVKGARVHARANLYSQWASEGGNCVTDSDGRYVFEHLSMGMYTIYVIPDSTLAEWIAPPLLNVGVGRGKTATGVDILLTRGIPLKGKVIGKESGQPVPGAPVSLLYQFPNVSDSNGPPSFQIAWTRSDENGMFQLPAIPGEMLLNTYLEMGTRAFGWSRGAGYLFIHIEAGIPVKEVELIYERGIDIHGRVRLPDGSPVAEVEIVSGNHKYAISNERGEFTLPGIIPEEHNLFRAFTRKGDFTAEFNVKGDPASLVDVVLIATEYVTTGGIVVDDNGKPVPGIPVELSILDIERYASFIRTEAAVTDSTGRFTVDRIPSGWHFQFYVRDGLAHSETFLAGSDKRPFRIVLPRADRWLEGTVRSAEGKPLAGMKVEASGSGRAEAVTDRNGRFRMEGLAAEQMNLSLQGASGSFFFENVPTNQRRDFTLPTGRHHLSGIVTDPEGNPLQGAIVKIHRTEQGGQDFAIETDSGGWFHLSDLGYAKETITVSHEGYREKTLRVSTDREDGKFRLEATGGK